MPPEDTPADEIQPTKELLPIRMLDEANAKQFEEEVAENTRLGRELRETDHKFKSQRERVQLAHKQFHEWSDSKPTSPETMHKSEDENNPAEQMRIIIRYYESRVSELTEELASVKQGYDQLDRNWEAVHEMAMKPLSEALGTELVPEMLAKIAAAKGKIEAVEGRCKAIAEHPTWSSARIFLCHDILALLHQPTP